MRDNSRLHCKLVWGGETGHLPHLQSPIYHTSLQISIMVQSCLRFNFQVCICKQITYQYQIKPENKSTKLE